ncbi:probable G-protein coupled receptor 19 [Anneissia japonica]|uniref:probable G-protein coupled receptor 19 n=1 Tax=Anneissia japonica TaxID=1529436 RepID=UPI00142552AC|nr:probable G-protein coupled receptor 19 [Anneissia japonica]
MKDTAAIMLQMTILLTLWLISFVGNMLVLIVVFRSKRLQSTTNYFVVSLASSDMLMTIFCMPFIATRIVSDEWILKDALCKWTRFVEYLVPSVTAFILVAISTDRFYTIIYPLTFKITRGTAKRLIMLSWLFAVLLSFPSFFTTETETMDKGTFCSVCSAKPGGRSFILGLFLMVYVFPGVMVISIYTKVVSHIWTVGISVRTFQRTSNCIPRAKVKTVKMLIFVTIVHFCSWLPLFCVQMTKSFSNDCIVKTYLYVGAVLLAYAPSASNVAIYSYYNSNFRRGCKEVFCMSTMRCKRGETYAITNASKLRKNNSIVPLSDSSLGTDVTNSSYTRFNRTANGDCNIAWPLASSGTHNTYL